ncbi:MAG: bifunctional heptose 7-phosphate kinase/heptose 1-phosphate adenyltransferase, partial [Terriglobia bacterium]
MNISISDRAALLSLIDRFARQEIVVLGDLVADEFIHGEIARVSREAPVLILRQREKHTLPGGAANAANNLADLGAKIRLAGAVGEDGSGAALLQYFNEKGISTRGVKRVKHFVTPTKSRVLGGLGHGHLQQIVRVDREPSRKLDRKVRAQLHRYAAPWLSRASAVLISDYGYGAVDPQGAKSLQRLRPKLPVAVDSRHAILRYNHVTASTPNEPEMEEAYGERVGNDLKALHRMAEQALHRCSLKALLVTRGREGMV